MCRSAGVVALAGGVCLLGRHLVWCAKCRRRVLGGRVAARCGELLERVAGEHGWEIVAKEVMPDHVHRFMRVGPTDGSAAVVGAFKGRTARVLRQEFPYLGRLAKALWSPPYFAASALRLGAPAALDRASVGCGAS